MHDSSLPEVSLVAYTQGDRPQNMSPDELLVYAVRGCNREESAIELYAKDASLEPSKLDATLRESAGRGPGAVLDLAHFCFQLESVPRLLTLFLCAPEYLSHLQQSFRRAKPENGCYLPDAARQAMPVIDDSLLVYKRLCEVGIPMEDARYVLPLAARTHIVTAGDARELMNLHEMSRQPFMPNVVRSSVQAMIDAARCVAPLAMKERAENYEVKKWWPCSQLFAERNAGMERIIEAHDSGPDVVFLGSHGADFITDEVAEAAFRRNDRAALSLLKHAHFTFLAQMSLSAFHQCTRQRTWHQCVEPIYSAASRRSFTIPPSISESGLSQDFSRMQSALVDAYDSLVACGVPKQEAVGVLPHSLKVYDLIHLTGFPAGVANRLCSKAQWDIREKARVMAGVMRKICPSLEPYIQPQCVILTRCPEAKSCGYIEKRPGKD